MYNRYTPQIAITMIDLGEEIRCKIQLSARDAVTSKLIAVKHMTFSGYGMADDEMWNEIISPMTRLATELKVWGEIGQYEY